MDDELSVRDSGERQVQQHEPSDWSVFRRGISYLKTSWKISVNRERWLRKPWN